MLSRRGNGDRRHQRGGDGDRRRRRGADGDPRHRDRRLALTWALGVFVTGIAIAGVVLVARPQASSRSTPTPSQSSAGHRVVRLTTVPGAVSNNTQTLAVLLGGTMPQGTAQATVTTDESCAPDAQGYSHCLNDLRLADGSVLHVRHNHQMSVVPCLTPGEVVIVQRA